jgi:hypothetical protein
MRTTLLALLCAALAGCGSLDLSNRVVCSLARDQALVVSLYGPIGIASKIDKRDRPQLCGPLLP